METQESKAITAFEMKRVLRRMSSFREVFVPEFTWGDIRIDAISIDLQHRWIRGFEIKTSHADFARDNKFALYTQVCSSVTIVCPAGLIDPSEVEKPFGLLWLQDPMKFFWTQAQWKKRPKNVQRRNSLSWLWTYVHVIETEMPRINADLIRWENEARVGQENLRKMYDRHPEWVREEVIVDEAKDSGAAVGGENGREP